MWEPWMWVTKETAHSSSIYRMNDSRMKSHFLSAFFGKCLAFSFKTIICNFNIRMGMRMVKIFFWLPASSSSCPLRFAPFHSFLTPARTNNKKFSVSFTHFPFEIEMENLFHLWNDKVKKETAEAAEIDAKLRYAFQRATHFRYEKLIKLNPLSKYVLALKNENWNRVVMALLPRLHDRHKKKFQANMKTVAKWKLFWGLFQTDI